MRGLHEHDPFVENSLLVATGPPAGARLDVSRESWCVEDVRPVIRRITVCDETSTTELPTGGHPPVVEMEMSTQPRGAKPGEILAAIGDFTEVRARRTHQWIERDGARQEPLDADTRPRVPNACAS